MACSSMKIIPDAVGGTLWKKTQYTSRFLRKKKKNVPILKDRSVTLLIVGSDAIQSVKDFFVKIKAGDFFIIFFYTESKMDS